MKKYSIEHLNLAKEYYLEHLNLRKTCKEFDIKTPNVLRNFLKENNIEIINMQNQIRCDEFVFDTIDTEEKAYWLGFLFADGNVASNRNRIELGLKEDDLEHIEKFKKFTKSSNTIHHKESSHSYRISLGSKHMKEQLILKGCVPNKSLVLQYPDENIVSPSLTKHFIRGYFDGDGFLGIAEYFNFREDSVSLHPRVAILGTKEFISKFVSNSNILYDSNRIRKQKNIFCYTFTEKEAYQFLDFIYSEATVFLNRKYEKYLTIKMNKEKMPSL